MFKCPSHGIKLLINSRYLKEERLVDLFREREIVLERLDCFTVWCWCRYSYDSLSRYLFK